MKFKYCRIIAIFCLGIFLSSCAIFSGKDQDHKNQNSSDNNSTNNPHNTKDNQDIKNNPTTKDDNKNNKDNIKNNKDNNDNQPKKKTPGDPYERYNRKVFKFNMYMDKEVLRPIAQTYKKVLPNAVQANVTHFFDNIDLIPSTINDAIQLNLYQALKDSSRFLVNSTVGIGGLYDVATAIKLPYHHNDFGLTLARYGMKKSDYVMLPIFGPSTVRDSISDPINIYMSVWPYVQPLYISYSAMATNKLNQRVQLLDADKLVEQSFDPYVFVRDAYLQHRKAQINQLGKVVEKGKEISNDTFVGGNASDTGDSTTDSSSSDSGGDTFVDADPNDKSANASTDSSDPYVAAEGESEDAVQANTNVSLPDPEMPDYINKKFTDALKKANANLKNGKTQVPPSPPATGEDTFVPPEATPAKHSTNSKHKKNKLVEKTNHLKVALKQTSPKVVMKETANEKDIKTVVEYP